MMPWRPPRRLTSHVIAVFNELRGVARDRAIATGNYDELVKQQPEREPGSDDELLDEFHPASQA